MGVNSIVQKKYILVAIAMINVIVAIYYKS